MDNHQYHPAEGNEFPDEVETSSIYWARQEETDISDMVYSTLSEQIEYYTDNTVLEHKDPFAKR